MFDLLIDLPLGYLVIEHVSDIINTQRPGRFAGPCRRLGIRDVVRQSLVLHLDRADRVFRGGLINRSHSDNLIPGPVNLFSGPLDDGDCLHARHLLRRAGINADHLRVRVGAAHRLSKQQSLRVVVVSVFGASLDFHRAVHAQVRLAKNCALLWRRPLEFSHDLRSLPRDLRDGFADTRIGSTAAQVAAQSVANLFFCRTRIFVEKRLAGHDEPWSAEAALLRVVLHEGLLNGMQPVSLAQRFHGRDRPVLRLNGQYRARVHGFVVQQHRTGAALSPVANALPSGQSCRAARPEA